MKRKHMPGCKCCGSVICPGPCGDIVYASADVVIDAQRVNCDQSLSFVIDSTLPDLFAPRELFGCDKTWTDTSQCSPPYMNNYVRQIQFRMAYPSPTQLRVVITILAWNIGNPSAIDFHQYGKTLSAPTSCSDWLSPIALDLEVFTSGAAGYLLNGITWNLSI